MNRNLEIEEIINEAVLNGGLPLAFLNSQIISPSNVNCKSLKVVNKKYLQNNLPDAESPILISKIYELL